MRRIAKLLSLVDLVVVPVCLLAVWGCSGGDGLLADGGAGSGGSVMVATGGRSATGGSGTGGAPGSGGAAETGGSVGHGGMTGGAGSGSGGTNTGGVATGGTRTGGSGAGGMAAGGSSTGGSSTGGTSAGGASSCTAPPAPSTLIGWASVSGLGQSAPTTGGGSATPQTVTSFSALKTAVAGDNAAVVYVKGVMAAGSLSIGSNKTVVGLCGAELHGHISLNGAVNVIFRNLKVVGYGVGDCTKDPKFDASVGCSSGDDAMTVQSAHHIWIDHCDVSDGTDGNLDIVKGSDFVTVSWTKFHYTPRTDNVGNDSTGASGHRFSNLVGSADDVPGDVGHLNVTWHHDWWADNVKERMPRTRNGKIHVLNNLFTAAGSGYCTNAGFQASLLVEGNVYDGVTNPLKPDANGDMKETNNVFTNTSGTKSASGKGFVPPYTYASDDTASLRANVMSGAGPH